MKKRLAVLLSGLMLGGNIGITKVFAEDLGVTGDGVIEAKIVFKGIDESKLVDTVGLKLKLGDSIVDEINLLDGERVSLSRVDGKVTEINIRLGNLVASSDYVLEFSGDNYITTNIGLDLSKYSKKVILNTDNLIGDFNSDSNIDTSDREILERAITDGDISKDINGDKEVDIEDISILNRNISRKTEALVYDTDVLVSTVKANISNEVSPNANIVLDEGQAISNLFEEGNELVVKGKDESEKVDIPLVFNEVEELSTFSFTLGDGVDIDSLEVNIIGSDGSRVELKEDAIKSRAMFMRSSERIITVDIGNRVPIKEINISVKPSENGDGYVVMKDVTFQKDVVDESVVEDTSVKNISVSSGDGSVSLSWGQVPNVKGYRVYYGTDANNLIDTVDVTSTSATINGLDNGVTYYFTVRATSDLWEGQESVVVSATPKTVSVPKRPDYVEAIGKDRVVSLSWRASEGADSYNVYMSDGADGEIGLVQSGIEGTSVDIKGLENGKVYRFYVTGVNYKGESDRSFPADAMPIVEDIIIPEIPTQDRIDNSNVKNVTMGHVDNVDKTLYPDGFDPMWLVDGDYSTHWVARRFFETNTFKFEFNEPKTMDYLIWVPRLDSEYRHANDKYTIEVWTDGMDLSSPGEVIVREANIVNKFDNNRYYALTFPKREGIRQIAIKLDERPGNTRVNGSEVYFYEYNDIPVRVDNLFSNSSRTDLREGVTLDEIEALRSEVNRLDNFIIERDLLERELNIAESLFEGSTDNLGYIRTGIRSIDKVEDIANYQLAISDLQPLGLNALAGDRVEVFADIPDGEVLEIVATQYHADSNNWRAEPIVIKDGRNVFNVDKIGSEYWDRGGALYVRYSGENPDDVKLQVFGAREMPYLELQDLSNLDEGTIKERIRTFVQDLEEHVPNMHGNLDAQALNGSEISLPNILLSLPASQVLAGLGEGSLEDKVNNLYDSIMAWDDVIDIVYTTYGIDTPNKSLQTRHNIRYMKMFSGAFMYAGGDHIGIQWNESKGLVQGTPLSSLEDGVDTNNLYGWGIAHEIGHVMDKLGHAELTNNIYSLMLQSANKDGGKPLATRLELGGLYPKIFNKVAIGNKGVSNDVFTQLGMYWQLRLAYGEDFIGEVYKQVRTMDLGNGSIDDKFMLAASNVSGKDLSEYFRRWGMEPSEYVLEAMSSKDTEDRAIWYLSDESIRTDFSGNSGMELSGELETSVNDNKDTVVSIQVGVTNEDSENIQGYEVIRNGKVIGFSVDGNYEDILDSGNFAYEYKVRAVDKVGNISDEHNLGEIKVVHDNVITEGVEVSDLGNNIVKIGFTGNEIVSGIKVTAKGDNSLPIDGEFKVYVKDMNNDTDTSIDTNTDTGTEEDTDIVFIKAEATSDDTSNDETGIETSNEVSEDTSDTSIDIGTDLSGSNTSEMVNEPSKEVESGTDVESSVINLTDYELNGKTLYLTFDSELDASGIDYSNIVKGFNNGFGLERDGTVLGYNVINDIAIGDIMGRDNIKNNIIALTFNFSLDSGYSLVYDSSYGNLGGINKGIIDDFRLELGGVGVYSLAESNEDLSSIYTLAKSGDFSKNYSDNTQESYITYLHKPDATDGEYDKIWNYETKEIIIDGIDLSKYNVEALSYTGDNIEFIDTAFGKLGSSIYGIPEGSLVVVGNYRGNTATNEVIIKGKFATSGGINGEEVTYEERAINGRVIMLDELPDSGKITSSTAQGLFIFVPDLEAEGELSNNCGSLSSLPVSIKAEMIKNSDTGSRVTSDTKWVDTPSLETLPTINFN